MPGITIGNNVVISGGSVVVKDIPDNVVAVENPAEVTRHWRQRSSEKNLLIYRNKNF